MENNDDQKIIKYINGQLTDAEKKAFEKEMANNKALSEEVEFYKNISTVTNHHSEKELKNKINNVVGELEEEGFFENEKLSSNSNTNTNTNTKIRRLKFMRPALATAASFLILIAAGFWYINSRYSNRAVADRFFDASTSLSTVRSETGNENKYEEGLIALENGDHEKAFAFFKLLLSGGNYTDIEKFEPAYYLSITYYQTGNFQQAANTSLPLATNDSRWLQKGRWLHLNALLSAGQTDQHFYDLLEAAKSDGTDPFYQKQAVALSAELDGFWWKVIGQ